MKNTLKNSIKKIAAITGSAVMLGATMLGAMAAADFSTITAKTGTSEFYTTNGELNAMVMVGTMSTDVLGAISDVAGAIDVAAAFAQKATLGGEGGGAMVAKNVTPGYLNTVGSTDAVLFGTTSEAPKQFDSGDVGFDWLMNETAVYNDTSYYLEEKIVVNGMKVKNLGATAYFQGPGGIAFNISSNTTMPLNFDQFQLNGQVYQIVAFANSTVVGEGTLELGQVQTENGINVGGFVDIGTTGVKLKLTGIKQTFLAWKAVFDIYDLSVSETTPVVTGVERSSTDATYSNDTLGIKFSVNSMYKDASDIWNVDVDWTEASIVLTDGVEMGDDELYPGYICDIGFNGDTGINWIQFRSPGSWSSDEFWPNSGTFSEGDSIDVLNGAFELTYEENRIGYDTTIDEGSENAISIEPTINTGVLSESSFEVIYKNNLTATTGVDLSNYLNIVAGVDGTWPNRVGTLKPTMDSTFWISYWNNVGTDTIVFQKVEGTGTPYVVDNVTCDNSLWTNHSTAGTWQYNVSCNSAQINLTMWSFTSNASYFLNQLTYTPQTDGVEMEWRLKLTEPTSETIYIDYNRNVTHDDYGKAEADPLKHNSEAFDTNDATYYTKYGTLISPGGDNFVLLYPEYQRVAKIYVGRTAETTETVNVGEQISTTGWYLKSGGGESPVWIFSGPTDNGIAALDSETVNRPVILVGGPGANAKVKSLYDAGTALQMNGTALTPEANTAYVELVENAFGTYDALIIAGTGAGDTRMACKVVSSQILYGTPLTNFAGTKLKLSTGVGTYSDVTAEAYI